MVFLPRLMTAGLLFLLGLSILLSHAQTALNAYAVAQQTLHGMPHASQLSLDVLQR